MFVAWFTALYLLSSGPNNIKQKVVSCVRSDVECRWIGGRRYKQPIRRTNLQAALQVALVSVPESLFLQAAIALVSESLFLQAAIAQVSEQIRQAATVLTSDQHIVYLILALITEHSLRLKSADVDLLAEFLVSVQQVAAFMLIPLLANDLVSFFETIWKLV